MVAFFYGVVPLLIWIGGGGLYDLGPGAGWYETWVSLSQLTGLIATLCALVGLFCIARVFGNSVGIDRLFRWHGLLGGAMCVALGLHIATSLIAWSDDVGFAAALSDLTGRQSFMALATVAALFVFIVALSSMRSLRRSMDYETWYYLHLCAYFAIAFALPHSLQLGNDFSATWTWWYWIALHVVAAAVVMISRWGRTVWATLRPWKVSATQPLNSTTTEIILESPAPIRAQAGQFAFLRPLARDLWWKSHPYSFSELSENRFHITVKQRGDSSSDFLHLQPGTKVAVTGPFGSLTVASLDPERRVIFLFGGVGMTIARPLLRDLPTDIPMGDAPIVFLRAHRNEDLVHYDEIEELVKARNGRLFNLVGSRRLFTNPFSANELSTIISDAENRQALLCGPDSLLAAARRGLLDLGIEKNHLHFERSWW